MSPPRVGDTDGLDLFLKQAIQGISFNGATCDCNSGMGWGDLESIILLRNVHHAGNFCLCSPIRTENVEP